MLTSEIVRSSSDHLSSSFAMSRRADARVRVHLTSSPCSWNLDPMKVSTVVSSVIMTHFFLLGV